jgi:hypothetical protein
MAIQNDVPLVLMAGTAAANQTTKIVFAMKTVQGPGSYAGYIGSLAESVGDCTNGNTLNCALVFGTSNYGVAEKMRLDWNGYLLVGYTSSNGGYRLQVNSQIFATNSTVATSDGRYKTNVNTLTNALSIVAALRPVSFNWKTHPVHAFDTATTTVGFIAQEVQQALADQPYLESIIKTNNCVVQEAQVDEAGQVVAPAVTEEFLGIAEGNMIAILTAAIQELKAANEQLAARVAQLEGN